MSTTIITNQIAIKFSVQDILDGIKHDINSDALASLVDTTYQGMFMFNQWQEGYTLLLEEYISSNVFPKIPSWNTPLPLLPDNELVQGYITKLLSSFEGGTVRFRGSANTKPESALRKLRSVISNASSFYDYQRSTRKRLDFYFELDKDADDEVKSIIKKIGITDGLAKRTEGAISIRCRIRVVKTSDILKVILINSVASRCKNITECVFDSGAFNT
jgi:hypothetical protein